LAQNKEGTSDIIMMDRGTNKTLGEMQSIVENDTTFRMASMFYTHIRGHPNKLVYKLRTIQRN
jgi:hypothetical protein